MAVGRTLMLGRRLIVLPKTDSKDDRLLESPGATLIAVRTCRKVASPFGAFGVNIVAKALADSPYSAFSLAIGLVVVSGGHVEINLGVGNKLLPKTGGESGISIRDDRSGETMDRADSFNEDVSSFNCCDFLRDWDKVGEPREAIQHN